MNPYDNNPFATDSKEIKNERDANRALAKEAQKKLGVEDWELNDPDCELNNWIKRDRDRKRNDGLNETLADMFAPMKQDKYGFWK